MTQIAMDKETYETYNAIKNTLNKSLCHLKSIITLEHLFLILKVLKVVEKSLYFSS